MTTFSEGVNGFAVGDITVGNGTASAFTGSDTEFTALITPRPMAPWTGGGRGHMPRASSIYDNTAPTVASIMPRPPRQPMPTS